ncbi:unnamed protein product [Protopolystoma xenopodis]|uniref:Cysteine protease n=1 Tax=Protopolystoma xenopodis TaxID=117903 RepID=A0A3S5B7Q7_9PLAT|nr:unnamed protein product [Protopolystoma xenopodis]
MSIFEQSHLKSFPSPYHALTQEVLALANGQPLPPRQTEELCYTDCTARHREASSTPAESFNSTYSSLSLTPSPFSSPSSYAASSFNSISFISSSPSLVIPSPAPSPFSTTFVSPDTNVYPSHLYRTPDHNILNNTVEGPHDHALASEAVLPTSQSNSVAPYPSASEGPIITPLAKPVLLLLPLMLGSGIRVPVRHTDLLLRLLADPLCVGLIGGRPRHSVYMAGCQGDRVIYFDPHFVQDCVDVSNGNFNVRVADPYFAHR